MNQTKSQLSLAFIALLTPGIISAPLLAQSAPATASASPALHQAKVKVDFSKSRGPFLHPERYNNISRARTFADQRDADIQFFNANGLHGQAYRTWIITNEIHDPATGQYDYSGVTDYLEDVSRLSNELLIVLDTRVQIRDRKESPEQIRPVIKRILLDLKKKFPMIRYVEAFNEPDHNLAKVTTPEVLYDYYKVYYEVVNEVNAELKPATRLEIGGPAFMQYNETWTRAFLDRYKADPSPGKRLDFFSYHAYGRFPEGTGDTAGPRAFHFYKTDPSEVAGERTRLEQEFKARGIPVNTPSFITELGIYPGPSFDNPSDARPDYLIGAAGVPSLIYWYLENPRNVPFNWVLRHFGEERKDQLITRAGADRKTPLTNVFTPYGNAMAMMAKLKGERVSAVSDALVNGKGVYAIATKDTSGAAVMVWNYQHTGSQSQRVTIDMGRLPPSLAERPLRQRLYRIDSKVSNYWANPETGNLQQVSESMVKPGREHRITVELTSNALELVVLEPVKRGR